MFKICGISTEQDSAEKLNRDYAFSTKPVSGTPWTVTIIIMCSKKLILFISKWPSNHDLLITQI